MSMLPSSPERRASDLRPMPRRPRNSTKPGHPFSTARRRAVVGRYAAFEKGWQSDEMQIEQIQGDVPNFIDLKNSVGLLVEEIRIIWP